MSSPRPEEKPLDWSRREFLVRTGASAGGLWLSMLAGRPLAVRAARASTAPLVFGELQWKTVEAVTARIIPTDDEPGALEAGCVSFIDKLLANEDAAARPLYETGLQALAAISEKRFGLPFHEVEPAKQDALLESLEDGSVEGWPEGPPPQAFFGTIRAHTILGFLADPKYGGNQGYAGWKVVGYPGPRHHHGGYTPQQMLGQEPIPAIWGGTL